MCWVGAWVTEGCFCMGRDRLSQNRSANADRTATSQVTEFDFYLLWKSSQRNCFHRMQETCRKLGHKQEIPIHNRKRLWLWLVHRGFQFLTLLPSLDSSSLKKLFLTLLPSLDSSSLKKLFLTLLPSLGSSSLKNYENDIFSFFPVYFIVSWLRCSVNFLDFHKLLGLSQTHSRKWTYGCLCEIVKTSRTQKKWRHQELKRSEDIKNSKEVKTSRTLKKWRHQEFKRSEDIKNSKEVKTSRTQKKWRHQEL